MTETLDTIRASIDRTEAIEALDLLIARLDRTTNTDTLWTNLSHNEEA